MKGDSAVTLRTVADAAGVHISTASRALDPSRAHRVSAATVARVRSVADSLGYRPDVVARGLRQGRTNTVGVMVADLANPFLVSVLRGVENVLEPNGFVPLIAETRDEPATLRKALDRLAERRVDALITTAALRSSAAELEAFADRDAPVVLVVRALPATRLPTVRSDDRLGAELVAGLLVQLGHRVLAQLCGPQEIQPFTDRGEAFVAKARELGAEIVDIDASAVDPTYEEGKRLTGYLLGRAGRLPTAVFVHNDPMAIGALEVLKHSGIRCPEHISLVGYNDNPFVDQVCPPLTTVRIHSYTLGREAATMALQLMAGERPPDVVIEPQLVVRESTVRHAPG